MAGHPLTLGRLLALVRLSGSALHGQPNAPLDLARVNALLKTHADELNPDSEEDAIRRTIRSQADGFAVWLRELVQNARDELRRYP